ncbi:MAG: transcription antitermination factor NusB [Dehalococcoidia bacterium]
MATGYGRKARVAALQALYEWDVAGHPIEECLERQLKDRIDDEAAAEFAQALVHGVLANQKPIDERIQQAATTWPLADMAAVDRNILRLAVYELLHSERTPIRAAINEAVELAKAYGSESSGRFVNGVLGSISMTATR